MPRANENKPLITKKRDHAASFLLDFCVKLIVENWNILRLLLLVQFARDRYTNTSSGHAHKKKIMNKVEVLIENYLYFIQAVKSRT